MLGDGMGVHGSGMSVKRLDLVVNGCWSWQAGGPMGVTLCVGYLSGFLVRWTVLGWIRGRGKKVSADA